MTTYDRTTAIHPKTLTGIMLEVTRGASNFVATKLIPEREINDVVAYYHQYSGNANLAPEVAEGQETPLFELSWTESTIRTSEYRIGGIVSDKTKYNFADVAAAEAKRIAENLLLRQEWDVLSTLAAKYDKATNSVALGSGKYWTSTISAEVGSQTWTFFEERVIDDINEAIEKVKSYGHVPPDTLVIGPKLERYLMLCPSFLGADKYKAISEGSIGRLRGLDVFVTDAFYIAEGSTSETMMHNDDAYVMKRGGDTGFTFVSEPMTAKTWRDENRRCTFLQGFKTFDTAIVRPKNYARIKDCVK